MGVSALGHLPLRGRNGAMWEEIRKGSLGEMVLDRGLVWISRG